MSPKTKNIIIWILSGILALAYLGAGLSKIFGAEMQVKNFESWGYPLWLRFPVGLIEIIFAIGLLITIYRKTIVYGIFIWTIIAIITHLQAGQANMIGGPIIFGLLASAILLLSREGRISPSSQM
ncbi:MAG TPA: DoxX family protein [Puia sp.]|nr:DoxX family protein [Puia sp.]